MKKLVCLLMVSCASPVLAQDFTATLQVSPGHVERWTASRPFKDVIPGNPDIVDVLATTDRQLTFIVKPEAGKTITTTKTDTLGPLVSTSTTTTTYPRSTNILLLDDNGKQVANLRVVIPGRFTWATLQGPDGWQVYRKDNPNYIP
jgi:hypothetical protein